MYSRSYHLRSTQGLSPTVICSLSYIINVHLCMIFILFVVRLLLILCSSRPSLFPVTETNIWKRIVSTCQFYLIPHHQYYPTCFLFLVPHPQKLFCKSQQKPTLLKCNGYFYHLIKLFSMIWHTWLLPLSKNIASCMYTRKQVCFSPCLRGCSLWCFLALLPPVS